jgi:hypothetical protein
MSTGIERTEERIRKIKQELMALGPMRPGSISRQYRQPDEKKGPFYQISYTRRMRSRSEYVRPEHLADLREETANFRRFKKLIDRWVELCLAASRLRTKKNTKRACRSR